MSIFEQQPKRKVHNYDEEEIEEYFSQYDEEEPRESVSYTHLTLPTKA